MNFLINPLLKQHTSDLFSSDKTSHEQRILYTTLKVNTVETESPGDRAKTKQSYQDGQVEHTKKRVPLDLWVHEFRVSLPHRRLPGDK